MNVTGNMRNSYYWKWPSTTCENVHTFPTHANNCVLRGESSVLSQNSELSSELKANTNSPESQEKKRRKTDKDTDSRGDRGTSIVHVETRQLHVVPSANGCRKPKILSP